MVETETEQAIKGSGFQGTAPSSYYISKNDIETSDFVDVLLDFVDRVVVEVPQASKVEVKWIMCYRHKS